MKQHLYLSLLICALACGCSSKVTNHVEPLADASDAADAASEAGALDAPADTDAEAGFFCAGRSCEICGGTETCCTLDGRCGCVGFSGDCLPLPTH